MKFTCWSRNASPAIPSQCRHGSATACILTGYRRPSRNESAGAKARRWLRQAVDRDARHVWEIDDWYDPGIGAELHRLHSIHRFETVIVEYVFLSRALSPSARRCSRS